jgi:ABC-type dipeptide/oligopeptide/nickel transport system ATPase component
VPPSREQMLQGLLRRAELPPGCRFAPRCPHAAPACFETAPTLEATGEAADHIVACWRWRDIAAADGRLALAAVAP